MPFMGTEGVRAVHTFYISSCTSCSDRPQRLGVFSHKTVKSAMEARTNIQVENKQYNATTCIQLHMFHCDKCLSHNCTGKNLLSLTTVLSSSSPLDVQGRSINKHQKFILGHLQPRTTSNLASCLMIT